MRQPRAVVITVSDSASRGERQDVSGPTAREELERIGCDVPEIHVLPAEVIEIQNYLSRFADREDIDLIVTTGGTGLPPRDVTPEATAAVIEKDVPGLAELMRREGMKATHRAALSRARAGV